MHKYKNYAPKDKSTLISVLQDVQSVYGYLPEAVLQEVADFIDMPLSRVYGVATFYSQFRLTPLGENVIRVCRGTACHVNNSANILFALETELKKIEHIKSQFVSMVAHELMTPIAAVLGFLKIILDPEFKLKPEQQTDYLSRSEKRLVTLVDMVNDLLDISRMEIGTKRREIKEIDLAEIIKSNTDFLELELKNRNITLNLDLPEGLPLLKADYNEISRLFTNIIGNSVKYNRENGSIDIKIKFENGNLITSISDTGIGMKPEEKNRLFQEFFRAKNESTRNIPDTGLGLSIVKRIAESYSGDITVESEYSKGSTFTVIFPLKQTQ
jgi:signal transduction histidine kinase